MTAESEAAKYWIHLEMGIRVLVLKLEPLDETKHENMKYHLEYYIQYYLESLHLSKLVRQLDPIPKFFIAHGLG